jgi:rhamnulokinase
MAGTSLGPLQKGVVGDSPALRGTRVIAVPGHDTSCAYDAMPAAPDGNLLAGHVVVGGL